MFSGLAVPRTIPIRRWTAIASFTLQAAAITLTLAYPLIYPQTLPPASMLRHIFTPATYETVTTTTTQSSGGSSILPHPAPLVVRQSHVFTFQMQAQDSSRPSPPDSNLLTGNGSGPGVLNSILNSNTQPEISPPPVHRIRTSVMMEGNLIHRVEPLYPMIAKQAGMQGTVVVRALISRTGNVEQPQVVSGPAMLGPAAVDAIRQWKYRPYILNGEPIEVETQITVNFILRR
jgi:protein TonB